MNIVPIAHIRTPFSEKFAIPRQARIVNEAMGHVVMEKTYQNSDSFKGLSAHSHYWLIWGFHKHVDSQKTVTVRPPRLGGNTKTSVFATRSPFRPNNLGMSIVRLDMIDIDNYTLVVSGVDMIDNSPIYDIKPYLPYSDIQAEAQSEWAHTPPKAEFCVEIVPEVQMFLLGYDNKNKTNIIQLLKQLLAYDVRPAYKSGQIHDDKIYGTVLYNVDIKWHISGSEVTVLSATVK